MAKRNPMNRRYQKDTQVGSTRKSAAAAKPKRSSGEGSSSSSSKSSSAKSSSSKSSLSRARVELPPDLKRLQKIGFGLLGGAVVLSVLYLWQGKQLGVAGSVMLGVAYALMFTALYIDFMKVRPWIKAHQPGGVGGKPSTPSKDIKATKKAASPASDDAAGDTK